MAITPDDKKISQFPEVVPSESMFIPLIDLYQIDPSLRNVRATITAILALAPVGGTVTGFSAGNLSPLFGTSVATSTSTPALSFSLFSHSANQVFAGPSAGGDAAPTFRLLVAADIPNLSGVYQPLDADLTAIAALGTTAYGRGFLVQVDAAGARSYIGAGTGSGSVTSVNITPPAAGITAAGGPITTSGSITLALADDLAALEALATTGYARRTGVSAWTLDTTIPAGSVSVSSVAGSTYDNLQQFINTMHSPGLIKGGVISNAGGGNISVSAGTAMLRVADDDVSDLRFVDFPAAVFAVPNDSTLHYVGLTYNSGTPILALHSSQDWDNDTAIAIGSAANVSGNILVFNNPFRTGDPITNIIQRFDSFASANRDVSFGGLAVGEAGTRNVTVSAGKIWSRLEDFAFSAQDTSASSTMISAYYNGTSWVVTPGVTQWPNTQYNDVTSGLVTMGSNKYSNIWFYASIETGTFGFQYGQAQYNTLADATAEAPPLFRPPAAPAVTLLLGRFVFKKSDSTAALIQQAFNSVFNSTVVTNHNDLSGLQGGTTNQYYHLTSDRHTQIAPIGDLSGTGFLARTGSATWATRTLTIDGGSTAALGWTNEAGLTGNPTLSIQATINSIAGLLLVQGDMLYASGSNAVTQLSKDTNATRYLSNTGASNNPAWAQINLANGVTDVLPVANGGIGVALTPSNNDVLQRKSGAWTNRTLAQYWTDLMADPTVTSYAYTALPFTINTDKRLLGRDAALPPFVAQEIAIGTSLGLSSSTLNTIQDIRTTASPTFAGLTLSSPLTAANGGTGISSLGTGVATALGINIGSAGSFITNGGALGTPSSGTVTNLTGTASININGTVGATTRNTGYFSSLFSSNNGDTFAGVPFGSSRWGSSFDGQNENTFIAYGSNSAVVLGAAGGTRASPTATASGVTIANFAGLGYDTTNGWGAGSGTSTARMVFEAIDSFTNTAQGSQIGFDVTPSGSSVSARLRAALLTSTGFNATAIGATTPSTGAFTTFSSTGISVFGAQARLKGYTVAGLPAGTQGDTAYVTNALAPTFLTAVAGGGAIVTPVFYDGTNWVSY